jgi:phosphatidylserine/phosphatidylglycerophosphate/cardiolipin synthase-like enzyme
LDLYRYDEEVTIRTTGSPSISVYFSPGKRITEGLCRFIKSAKKQLDVCIYDLDHPAVTQELIDAKNRGVKVRIVTDSDNRQLRAVDRLDKAGIRIVADERSTIMHNKFVVVDGRRVWTGSFNFTENGEQKNDNNALILDSPELAEYYQEKFDRYLSGDFGVSATTKTDDEGKARLGKISVRAAFSPSDKVADIICEQLSDAKECVYVMAFVLTSEKIARKLGELAKSGVKIHCVLDRGQARTRYSQSQFLLGCGVKMHIAPNSKGKMHHKVITIDEDTVITGSYNFSENAEKGNDENIIIIKSPDLAKLFNKEFKRCLNGTKGY